MTLSLNKFRSVIASGAVWLLLAGHATHAAELHATVEPGVWQKHEYSFAYLGFTSTYSCDGLADKLKVLLLAAGARSDLKVRAGGCAGGFGRPDRFARADLTFYTLAPTSSAVAAADSKPIDGTWVPVTLAQMHPRELQRGDCELVEQFNSAVLPMFTTRNLQSRTTCVPHQDSGSLIDVKFDTFSAPLRAKMPVTAPTAANITAQRADSAVP